MANSNTNSQVLRLNCPVVGAGMSTKSGWRWLLILDSTQAGMVCAGTTDEKLDGALWRLPVLAPRFRAQSRIGFAWRATSSCRIQSTPIHDDPDKEVQTFPVCDSVEGGSGSPG